jgi:hypothetical protein
VDFHLVERETLSAVAGRRESDETMRSPAGDETLSATSQSIWIGGTERFSEIADKVKELVETGVVTEKDLSRAQAQIGKNVSI